MPPFVLSCLLFCRHSSLLVRKILSRGAVNSVVSLCPMVWGAATSQTAKHVVHLKRLKKPRPRMVHLPERRVSILETFPSLSIPSLPTTHWETTLRVRISQILFTSISVVVFHRTVSIGCNPCSRKNSIVYSIISNHRKTFRLVIYILTLYTRTAWNRLYRRLHHIDPTPDKFDAEVNVLSGCIQSSIQGLSSMWSQQETPRRWRPGTARGHTLSKNVTDNVYGDPFPAILRSPRPRFCWNTLCPTVTDAVYTGNPEAVGAALERMGDNASVVRALRNASYRGRTPIIHAARRGDVDVFNAVLIAMETRLTPEQVRQTRRLLLILSRCEKIDSSTSLPRSRPLLMLQLEASMISYIPRQI